MNTRKFLMLIAVVLYCFSGAYASKNDKGIDYYRAELYDAAKLFFQQQTNLTQEEQAENYFYLGQVYAATQKLDSAAYFYKKATETDPEYPYGYIGEGKLLLDKKTKESIAAANDLFKKAMGFAKKDPAIATAVAEAYIKMKEYDEAEIALDRARKIKKDYSGIYVAEGDMLMSKGAVGDASGRYETAVRFNPSDKTAYLKYARVYKTINPALALENLEKLLAVDPEYIPAYAELGDLYYKGIEKDKPNYNKAIEAYEKLKDIPGAPLAQEVRYAQLLYFTDRFPEAAVQIRKVLEKDPSNYIMKRIRAYNNYKLEEYTLGLEQMTTFMRETKPEDLISLDYTFYGNYLKKTKQYPLAAENFKKAYDMDTAKFELLKEVAESYQSANNYVESVNYSQKFLNSNPNAEAGDFFFLGRSCWLAVRQMITADATAKSAEQLVADSLQRDKYLEIGEKSFATVIERFPENYTGYFWMGNMATLRDILHHQGTAGLAKEYYEKALPLILASNQDGKKNRDLIEIYAYMGTYYFAIKEDSKTSQEYWTKILEIDPENARAKKIMEEFNKVKK